MRTAMTAKVRRIPWFPNIFITATAMAVTMTILGPWLKTCYICNNYMINNGTSSLKTTLLVVVNQVSLYSWGKRRVWTFLRGWTAEIVVLSVVPDLHKVGWRICQLKLLIWLAVLLVELKLDATGKGDGLGTVAMDCLILELLSHTLMRCQVQKDKKWCHCAVVTAEDSQFSCLLSTDYPIHLF